MGSFTFYAFTLYTMHAPRFLLYYHQRGLLTLLRHLLPASAQPSLHCAEHSHLALQQNRLEPVSTVLQQGFQHHQWKHIQVINHCSSHQHHGQPEWQGHWTRGWEGGSLAQGAASLSRRTQLWSSTCSNIGLMSRYPFGDWVMLTWWNRGRLGQGLCSRSWWWTDTKRPPEQSW